MSTIIIFYYLPFFSSAPEVTTPEGMSNNIITPSNSVSVIWQQLSYVSHIISFLAPVITTDDMSNVNIISH